MFASSNSLLDASSHELLTQFELVCKNASLITPNQTDIGIADGSHWDLPGVYLWSVVTENTPASEHVVYVGKTKSFRRRIKEYRREFQAHSPNDYKLQVFQHEVQKRDTHATFRLYFRALPAGEITVAENEAVSRFNPMLNQRASISSEARADFKSAFEKYYAAGFNAHFIALGDTHTTNITEA